MGGYPIMDPSAIPPPGFANQQRAGVLVTQHSLLQVDVVFTALRIISNNIVKMGDLWPYQESLTDDNIPYRQFLANRPAILTDTFGGGQLGGRGGAMMQCTGRDRTVWSMALFGEAFWYVLERDSRVRPACLEVLHPAFMEIKEGPNGPRFIYGTGVDKQELDPDDVIQVPFKTMPQARRALSPITYAGVAGALAMAAYEFGSTWFSQGAAPSFLLKTTAKLGQEEVERIAQKFAIQHSGLTNAHLPLVLDAGMEADKLLANPDEAQYLHTLEYARNVIASWFGLPPSLLGNALERQSPPPAHTSEEESTKFLQHTLSGYLIPLEEAHSGLLPKGMKACFNENALAKPDSQFLSELVLAIRQSQTMSIDELRARYYGLGPLPDGQGKSAIAPLASNTAPSQTDSDSSPDSSQQQPDDGEKQALRWLWQRFADPGALLDELSAERRQNPLSVVVHPADVKVDVSVPERRVSVEPAQVTVNNEVQPATAPKVTVRNEVQPANAPEVTVRNEVQPANAPDVNIRNEVQPANAPEVKVENRVDVQPAAPEIRVEPSTAEVRVENEIDVLPADVTVNVPRGAARVKRGPSGRIEGVEYED